MFAGCGRVAAFFLETAPRNEVPAIRNSGWRAKSADSPLKRHVPRLLVIYG